MPNLTLASTQLTIAPYFIVQLLKLSDMENHDDSPLDVTRQRQIQDPLVMFLSLFRN